MLINHGHRASPRAGVCECRILMAFAIASGAGFFRIVRLETSSPAPRARGQVALSGVVTVSPAICVPEFIGALVYFSNSVGTLRRVCGEITRSERRLLAGRSENNRAPVSSLSRGTEKHAFVRLLSVCTSRRPDKRV